MKSLIATLFVLTISALSWPALAQVESDYVSDGPILISNITVIDGLGNHPVSGQDILITNGRINEISN